MMRVTDLTNKNAVIYTEEGNFDRQASGEVRAFGVRLSYHRDTRVKGE
jgi:hypothetical protein